MIEFRQKDFSKKLVEWGKEQIKKTNPITAALSVAGTGLGIANLHVNKQRKDADKKLREEQIKTMDRLTETLEKINEEKLTKNSKKVKRAFRRKLPEDQYPTVMQKILKKND